MQQTFPIELNIDSWGGNRNLTLDVRQTHSEGRLCFRNMRRKAPVSNGKFEAKAGMEY